MKTYTFNEKTYDVTNENFLINHKIWDEDFAAGMTQKLGMNESLTKRHWEVIHFIRNRFKESGACPVVNETTMALGLDLKSLQQLFPTGYLRGACLLAGITYLSGWVYHLEEPYTTSPIPELEEKQKIKAEDKVYRVDLFGYLVDPSEWDENYATRRAYEMNIKSGLTEKHWKVIQFLRESYVRNKKIPTIYECCEVNQIEIQEFAEMFPTGYHRGAVKIAGLPAAG